MTSLQRSCFQLWIFNGITATLNKKIKKYIHENYLMCVESNIDDTNGKAKKNYPAHS